MLTFKDCLALCDLSEEEVKAIAEHEHIPQLAAMELGNYLVRTPDGVPMIRKMIVDDIAAADARGDTVHALKLRYVLYRFAITHPDPHVQTR